MAYTGVIIAFDLAGTTGVAEGCPGERPVFDLQEFAREGAELIDNTARAIRYVSQRIQAARFIGNRSYGVGEAADEGMVRVAIEAPIRGQMKARNVDSHEMSLGLYAAVGGFARGRHITVQPIAVQTVRKHFIGRGTVEAPNNPKHLTMAMCRQLGWNPPNLDCADAGAVWHWACAKWNFEATPVVAGLYSRLPWRA